MCSTQKRRGGHTNRKGRSKKQKKHRIRAKGANSGPNMCSQQGKKGKSKIKEKRKSTPAKPSRATWEVSKKHRVVSTKERKRRGHT